MTDRGIRLSKQGIALGNQIVPFLSGSCHYWRLERSKWPMILDLFVELGLPILQTYVPWSVHETGPGQFDFGDFTPNKDLPDFLNLCKEAGLYVFLRPGPHINAEITYFGFPKRLFENPENLSVSATGSQVLLPAPPRAFPALSYASEHFYKELAVYFDAFAKVAQPFCYPDGPVIGIQADNEMSYFFRTGAYDHDYSHWAHEMYYRWLKEKYGDLETLRAAYNRSLASFSEVTLPTAFHARNAADLPAYIDWAEFKEEMLHRPLDRMLEMLQDRGFEGLLTFHNYPMNSGHTPFNVSRGEEIFDLVGVDYYNKKTDYTLIRKRFLALAATSRFPVSPEFSSGCYQAWAPIDLDDQNFTTYLAIACGLRGFNFYMIVERERWYGSPITRHGEYREDYAAFYKKLTHFLSESGVLAMDRKAEAILLRVRDYDRLEKAADLLSPLPPLVFETRLGAKERCHEGRFGFDYSIQIEHEAMFDAWYQGLTRAKIPFAVSDTDIDPSFLSKYKVVFAPSFEFMGRRAQNLLHAFVEAGGMLVMGPGTPVQDANLLDYAVFDPYLSRPVHKLECQPDTFVFNAVAGRIIMVNGLLGQDLDSLDRTIAEVCRITHLRSFYCASGACETSLFTDSAGRQVLFVINPTSQPRRPRIETGGNVMLRDYLTGEEFYGKEHVPVHMEPSSIRPLEVCAC